MNEITLENLANQKWRLNNLYAIRDRTGSVISFKLNTIQEKLFESLHIRNLILKVRRSGISTFILVYMLDSVLFTPVERATILVSDLPEASEVFNTVSVMLSEFRGKYKTQVVTEQSQSENKIVFDNGSVIEVTTKVSGAPYGLLYITDFTGSMKRNGGQYLFESRAYIPYAKRLFIDTTDRFEETVDYLQAKEAPENREEFKLHFFPWWSNPNYVSEDSKTLLTDDDEKYFEKVEIKCGKDLSYGQKLWYTTFLRMVFTGDREYMRHEFPSYWEEVTEV